MRDWLGNVRQVQNQMRLIVKRVWPGRPGAYNVNLSFELKGLSWGVAIGQEDVVKQNN